MEHIVYLIALQNPNDLKKVRRHASMVSEYYRRINAGAVKYAALASAEWTEDYGSFLCIGDNRQDSLVFYPINQFKRHLSGYSFLPIKAERTDSVFGEFESFCNHEMRSGANNANESYHIFIIDFRKKSSVFVGNEADEIVKSLDYNFGNRSTINLIYREENKSAYRRLEDLLPKSNRKTVATIGSLLSGNPFSYKSVVTQLENN